MFVTKERKNVYCYGRVIDIPEGLPCIKHTNEGGTFFIAIVPVNLLPIKGNREIILNFNQVKNLGCCLSEK